MLADQHAHLMNQRVIRKVLDRRDEAATDLVTCPKCQAPASLDRGLWLDSTDGPVEHGRLRCAAGCGPFLAPIDHLLAGALAGA